MLYIMTGGNIEIFAFPLNVILLLIWAGAVITSWHSARDSAFVRFMLRPAATVSAIIITLIFSLIIGLTGYRSLVTSCAFITVLLYFQTVLAYVLLRGWRRNSNVRWRFVFLHFGLLLAVASSFWSAPDNMTYRTKAVKDTPVSEVYTADGRREWLKYDIELKESDVTYDNSGVPSDYCADVLVDGRSVTLKVNHPYSVSLAETVYLTSIDARDLNSCVLQIVYEPCRYVTLAGIVMMLIGAMLLFINGPRKRKEVLS